MVRVVLCFRRRRYCLRETQLNRFGTWGRNGAMSNYCLCGNNQDETVRSAALIVWETTHTRIHAHACVYTLIQTALNCILKHTYMCVCVVTANIDDCVNSSVTVHSLSVPSWCVRVATQLCRPTNIATTILYIYVDMLYFENCLWNLRLLQHAGYLLLSVTCLQIRCDTPADTIQPARNEKCVQCTIQLIYSTTATSYESIKTCTNMSITYNSCVLVRVCAYILNLNKPWFA